MSGVRSAFGRREATRSQRFACTQLLMIGLHDVVGNLEFSAWALAFVVVYYSLASILVRRPGALRPIVPRYEPPPGASPAVTATLLEPGDLPLSIAAALVNMAAKRYIRIEQNGDLFSVIQLNNQGLPKLEPEEHILQRNLLDKYDFFDFDFSSPQLDDAVRAFPWALYNTGYISRHYGTSLLAWIVSAAAVFLALIQAQPSREWGRVLGYDLACTFACFILTVRTMRGPLDKLLCRLPGGAAPQRPWTGADRQPFFIFVGHCNRNRSAVPIDQQRDRHPYRRVHGCERDIFHALQGPTSAGRKMAAQLREYRKFLSEVEADPISRRNSGDQAPAEFDVKVAYAIAFHLDLGWGEQFVTAIADLIEVADVRETFLKARHPLP